MTVAQAINAVPPDSERYEIEADVLAAPLQNLDAYAECNLTPQTHFTVKVAVWNGRAVGIDVRDASAPLAECVKKVVQGLQWKPAIESLNTIEFTL
jgi:hypothetical protein